MTTPNEPQAYEDDDQSEPADATQAPRATGFEPPQEATRARFRRLNAHTGGWEDAPVIIDGVRTATVDSASATPNLPLAEAIPTNYRITWYASSGKVLGYSKVWRVGPNVGLTGGASNTPRMWPAGETNPGGMPQGGSLSPSEVLTLLRGLAMVVHEAAAPMVAQVQTYHEQMFARERAFHEARLQAEAQRHAESIERDRAFMAAMRDVHEKPRDERIRTLEAKLATFEEEAPDEEEAPNAQNGYALASAAIEHAPEIIRTIAQEVRQFGDAEKLSTKAE